MEPKTLIPLFPLNVVLFPGEPLPLHIFEERYKQMVQECLVDGGPFGMVLAAPGGIHAVGCTAPIEEVLKTYDDGRMDILVRGGERFRVLDVFEDQPYFTADVAYFSDSETTVPQELTERVGKLFGTYLEATELPVPAPDPLRMTGGRLSFFILQYVLLGLEERQEYLSLTNEEDRLERLETFLSEAIENMKHRKMASGNGKLR